jgi:hypothetical protein
LETLFWHSLEAKEIRVKSFRPNNQSTGRTGQNDYLGMEPDVLPLCNKYFLIWTCKQSVCRKGHVMSWFLWNEATKVESCLLKLMKERKSRSLERGALMVGSCSLDPTRFTFHSSVCTYLSHHDPTVWFHVTMRPQRDPQTTANAQVIDIETWSRKNPHTSSCTKQQIDNRKLEILT